VKTIEQNILSSVHNFGLSWGQIIQTLIFNILIVGEIGQILKKQDFRNEYLTYF